MIFINILHRYYILFIFQVYYGVIYSDILYSYELHFTKEFKLYNNNIIMAGDKGIYTYDNTGTNYIVVLLMKSRLIKRKMHILPILFNFQRNIMV